jgi:hypothetical protein
MSRDKVEHYYLLKAAFMMLGMSSSSLNIWNVLTVDYRIKVHMDLQADKSPVVVNGPFFPRVLNPRYRIHGTLCNASIKSSKARKAIL